jgi:hypothetical protein
MSPSLPAATLAEYAGRCLRCPRDREPDSDHCAECDVRQRGYVRKSKAQRRKERRIALQCIDCGNQLPRSWDGSRCKRCRKVQSVRAKSRRVKRSERRVKQQLADLAPARGHYKAETFADGATRTRYVGQAHRGGPTREEQDASLVKLVLSALGLAQGFLEAFPSERAAIDALPRIQRAEAWEMLASRLTRSARLQLEVAGSLAATWRETCAGCGRAHEADNEG